MSEPKNTRITMVYNGEIYRKDEADNVIDCLKESVKSLILDNYLKDKEIRRHKHKRCLAMAKQCGSSAQLAWDHAFSFNNTQYAKRALFCEKWRNRWLAIAEKFKEGV